jgi:SAM-dependent methyltransferase
MALRCVTRTGAGWSRKVPDGSPRTTVWDPRASKFRPKGQFVNQYTGITECYDLLMRGGYYDHDTMARAADAVIGDRKKVLELGVGTGLFAQSLATTKPDCDITGVDFTPSMLELAQDRVGADARLIEADVTSMDLEDTFDAAISSGGVWVIIDAEDEFLLGTHLPDYDNEVQGLKNVSSHLEPDGLLLLSIQEMHDDFDLALPDGVVYSQRISTPEQLDDNFTIEKEYSFTRGSEILGEETLNLGFYRRGMMDQIIDEAGFEFEGIDDERQFFVYSNRGEPAMPSA